MNVFPHSRFSATECPTSLAGTQNAAYMAKAQQWYDSMTGGTPAPTPSQPATHGTNLEALADDVIRGDYGNGDERKQRLGSQYDAVMAIVNARYGVTTNTTVTSTNTGVDIDGLARRVINGEFGVGDARKAALGSNYEAVQARVNQLLAGGTGTSSTDLNALADAVIRGDYGNGAQRQAALGANYNAVQALVNKKLGY